MAALEILLFTVIAVVVGGVYLKHRWHQRQVTQWKVKRIYKGHDSVDLVVYKPGQQEHVASAQMEGSDLAQYYEEISQAETLAFERAGALNILDKANRRK